MELVLNFLSFPQGQGPEILDWVKALRLPVPPIKCHVMLLKQIFCSILGKSLVEISVMGVPSTCKQLFFFIISTSLPCHYF